jgi:hypothetical protein
MPTAWREGIADSDLRSVEIAIRDDIAALEVWEGGPDAADAAVFGVY